MNELAAERQREIVQILNKEGKVIVSDLAIKFNVASATIRRDLDMLNEKYKLIRVHGGAIFPNFSTSFEPQYSEKSVLNHDIKKRIGIVGASLVQDGDTLFLDSGTTAYQVAENLSDKNNLKVLTTDLKIGCLLSSNINIEVIMIGGNVRTNQFNCVGFLTQKIISELNADMCFLALDGFDIERGITVTNIQEAAVKQYMLTSSRRVIAITDHTKLKRISMISVCPISEVDILITDNLADNEVINKMDEMNIQIMLT